MASSFVFRTYSANVQNSWSTILPSAVCRHGGLKYRMGGRVGCYEKRRRCNRVFVRKTTWVIHKHFLHLNRVLNSRTYFVIYCLKCVYYINVVRMYSASAYLLNIRDCRYIISITRINNSYLVRLIEIQWILQNVLTSFST